MYFIKRNIINMSFIFIVLLGLTLLTGCGAVTTDYSQTATYFDTIVSITIYAPGNKAEKTQEILDSTLKKCEYYDNLFSRNNEESDIYRINHADGEWTTVSDETITLLYSALYYCKITNGAIDITAGSVKDLWSFTKETTSPPPLDDVRTKLLHVDFSNVQISGNKVKLKDPDASLDLGFIAKGYIADQLKSELIASGVTSAIINLGGNVQTIGHKPEGKAFKVGIQTPFEKVGTYSTVVSACEKEDDIYSSVVTSGIYERYFNYNGKIFHHILDTQTGLPVENDLLSATILTDSSMEADGLSTACMVLGLEKARELVSQAPHTEAIFITKDYEVIDTRN